MLSNPTPSRPGALPFPQALKIQMTLLQVQGSDVNFELASSTPGVIVPGDPPKISLVGIRQPVLITIQLVGDAVQAMDVHLHGNPFDAMSFAKGVTLPTGPGNTANGMFMPLTVSADGRELTFLAANTGDGEDYRAKFHYTFSENSQTAAASGGPIIIND